MLGGARWSAMLGGAKGTRTHVCPRPWLEVFSIVTFLKTKLHNQLSTSMHDSMLYH